MPLKVNFNFAEYEAPDSDNMLCAISLAARGYEQHSETRFLNFLCRLQTWPMGYCSILPLTADKSVTTMGTAVGVLS